MISASPWDRPPFFVQIWILFLIHESAANHTNYNAFIFCVSLSILFFFFLDLIPQDSANYTCLATSPSGNTSWYGILSVEDPSRKPASAFHRTPGPETLPGPPSKPRPINISETTITLVWNRNQHIGASNLIGEFRWLPFFVRFESINAMFHASLHWE